MFLEKTSEHKCRPILTFLLMLSLLALSCENLDQREIPSISEKPNVLFIVADDLNCDLGPYGNKLVHTPNLDKLAARATVFENAHSQYPHCGPSRASFMTGLYTDQTKMTQNNIFLRNTLPDVITLGQRFRQQGYTSVRIGKIFHYDNPSAIGSSGHDDIYSWDQTINPRGRDKTEEYKINTLSPRKYGGTLSWLSANGIDEEQTDGIAATEAIEQLQHFAQTGEPFFLALGFFRPHTPFVAPHKHFEHYNPADLEIPESSEDYLKTIPVPAAKSLRVPKSQIDLDKDLAQEIKQAYYATVTMVDAQIGRVLDMLEKSGLDQNTVVVFISDHGYHLGEHGHWQKQTLFDNSTRVPLILATPGEQPVVTRTNAPVELIDLYPTIMDYTGITPPTHLVGSSLKPLIDGEIEEVRSGALTRWRQGYSLKTDRYRITKWGPDGELGFEFYDHDYDIGELTNLAADSGYHGLLDSLKIVLDLRIADAQRIPEGLGRQIENAERLPKAQNITLGDLYDEEGELTFTRAK